MMLILCCLLFGFAVVGLLLGYIAKIYAFFKPAKVCLILAAIIFIACDIVPYSLQQRDYTSVSISEKNILLYEGLIQEYTEAAQKQISDYQQMQSQMAKMASSIQLQYYSQQVDAVGNKLTDQIKAYRDEIINWKIEINKANARIEFRPQNKWVFGL